MKKILIIIVLFGFLQSCKKNNPQPIIEDTYITYVKIDTFKYTAGGGFLNLHGPNGVIIGNSLRISFFNPNKPKVEKNIHNDFFDDWVQYWEFTFYKKTSYNKSNKIVKEDKGEYCITNNNGGARVYKNNKLIGEITNGTIIGPY